MKLRKNNNCTREKGEGKHARDKSQHAEASPHNAKRKYFYFQVAVRKKYYA